MGTGGGRSIGRPGRATAGDGGGVRRPVGRKPDADGGRAGISYIIIAETVTYAVRQAILIMLRLVKFLASRDFAAYRRISLFLESHGDCRPAAGLLGRKF